MDDVALRIRDLDAWRIAPLRCAIAKHPRHDVNMVALPWLYPAIAAPFVGSFVGVVVTRLSLGRSVVWGRSACPRCGHDLGPSDLIPIASWLLSRGRCRYCTDRVSRLYPAIELAAFGLAIWGATAAGTLFLLWASCG